MAGDVNANEEIIIAKPALNFTPALAGGPEPEAHQGLSSGQPGAVQKITSQAEAQRLDWSAIEQIDDTQLARLFYPEADIRASALFELPNWFAVHQVIRAQVDSIVQQTFG